MSLIGELYEAKIEISLIKEELEKLKEDYDNYRRIIESYCNNKKVKDIQKHISWYSSETLKTKAKEVEKEEWLDYCCDRNRRQERRRQREERRREEEKKKRAAERKALEELMEKERKERARKNQEAN